MVWSLGLQYVISLLLTIKFLTMRKSWVSIKKGIMRCRCSMCSTDAGIVWYWDHVSCRLFLVIWRSEAHVSRYHWFFINTQSVASWLYGVISKHVCRGKFQDAIFSIYCFERACFGCGDKFFNVPTSVLKKTQARKPKNKIKISPFLEMITYHTDQRSNAWNHTWGSEQRHILFRICAIWKQF